MQQHHSSLKSTRPGILDTQQLLYKQLVRKMKPLPFQPTPHSIGLTQEPTDKATPNPNDKIPKPTFSPTTNMCQGIRYIHTECHHLKKLSIVETCNLVTRAGCANLQAIHTVKITAPRLYVPCFRREEANIDADYETTKMDMQSEMARVDETFANGWVGDEEAAVSLKGYRAECEDVIVQTKAARDVRIRLFRQRQGVWSDG